MFDHPTPDQLPTDRKAARAAGSLLYMLPSIPCRAGHLSPRRTTTAKCVQCVDAELRAAKEARRAEAYKAGAPARAKKLHIKRAAERRIEATREAKRVAREAAARERKHARTRAKAAATRARNRAVAATVGMSDSG